MKLKLSIVYFVFLLTLLNMHAMEAPSTPCIVTPLKKASPIILKQIQHLSGHSNLISSLIFDDNQLISCSFDRSIIIWDLQRGIKKKILNRIAKLFIYLRIMNNY